MASSEYIVCYTLRRLYDGDGDIHRVEDVDCNQLAPLETVEAAQAEVEPDKLLAAAESWVDETEGLPDGTYFVEAAILRLQDGLSWMVVEGLESECVEVSSQ